MSKSKCRDLFVFSIHCIVIRHCLEFLKCATFWNVPLRSGHLKQCKHYDRDAYIHSYNAPNGKVAAIFHWCVFAIVDCMKRGANNALSPHSISITKLTLIEFIRSFFCIPLSTFGCFLNTVYCVRFGDGDTRFCCCL